MANPRITVHPRTVEEFNRLIAEMTTTSQLINGGRAVQVKQEGQQQVVPLVDFANTRTTTRIR